MNADQDVIGATRRWIESVVVQNNFCPFAARELARGSILYRVTRESRPESCLEAMVDLCRRLDEEPDMETALLICPQAFGDFEDYLDFVELAERLSDMQGYEGVYQIASFHPEYCFAGAARDDPANYTNRSPYPMLHLLRESSIERALQSCPDPGEIPERNIETARRIGLAGMQALLRACRKDGNTE